ncbi:MAG: threonine synthase [Chloroflexi bacterium]|nr:threonine synthase [Chloroflexota bacterium]
MSHVTGLRCRECGREYPIEPLNVCDFCFGPLEVSYDYDAIAHVISRESIAKGPLTMWRYEDLLPVDGANAVDIATGFTPLIKAKNLGRVLGLDNLYIKNDSVNPSYSFKDRVVSVAATKALEFGFDTLACASTGNLAGAVAAHGAKAGMKVFVFIPADLEEGKIIGTAIYGAKLVAAKGSYDDVNRLCSELADTYRWAFVNINMRPYYSEGSKTLGYEVAEQLGWRAPDHAIVPAASGSLFTKIWKGLKELSDLGLIGQAHTKMHLIQAQGCSPIVEAYRQNSLHVRPIKPNTIAKSLAIGNPADGFYALKTLKATGGRAEAVPEEEVIEGIKLLAETEGVFTEAAGGVTVAGLRQLANLGVIEKNEVTVAYITGNGLKTQEIVRHVANPLIIEPNMESFEAAFMAAGGPRS